MKRLRVLRGAAAPLLGVVLALMSVAGFAQAPARIPTDTTVTDSSAATPAPATTASAIADVLRQGRALETDRRWPEAFALYEETSRQNPNQPELEQRLDLAKMHFDIGRRQNDATFRRAAGALSDAEALDMFTDAATKLQAHYVQNPDFARLVARGTRDLEIALAEPTFLENNLGKVNSDRVDVFVRELRRQMSQSPVRNRDDAREAVWNAAQLAKLHLGLRPSTAMLEYTAAMLGGLDEYSTFLTSGQLNDLYSQIEGNFVGLGVELKSADGGLLIVNVIANSPALRAGIHAGDRIVEVGGKSTVNLNTDQAAELLQGPEGSQVELALANGDQLPRRVTVKREHVDVPSVDDIKIVDRDFGIGYFKLTCFEKTTARDVDAALWQLQRQGMKSLIIDLRGNPGGLLTSSVEVADRFLEQGTIVSTKGRSLGEDYNYTAQRPGTWSVPLVVLIDGDSASAAEILSGALRDLHRATVVGVRSYGKGSVQGIFPLSIGGAGVRLTTAKFYSPTGKPYARVGVEPDVTVRTAAKPADGKIALPVSTGGAVDDPILNAGLQAARRQVAQR